jgi:MFS family permease
MDIDVYRNKWWIMAGKKRIFTAGLVVFVVGSVLCGVAPSISTR